VTVKGGLKMDDLTKLKFIKLNVIMPKKNGQVRNLYNKDFEWLIEQAEKVEQLEKRLNELAQTNYCIICGDDATEERQGSYYCYECCK
jgi:hypothetical protein